MSCRLFLSVVLGGSVFLSGGCCGRAKPAAIVEESGVKSVTLHVKDMTERLKLA